jgi:hypothetical protein
MLIFYATRLICNTDMAARQIYEEGAIVKVYMYVCECLCLYIYDHKILCYGFRSLTYMHLYLW